MAQIIKRGRKKYLVRVFLGRDPSTGKQLYHNKTVTGTRKEAEGYATGIQHQVSTGTYHESSHQTVAEYLTDWLDHTAARKVRPRTLEGYRDQVRVHLSPVLGDVPLGQLSADHVQRVVTTMEEKGRAPQTIRNALGVLRNALGTAVRRRAIPMNPASADLVDLPRLKRRELAVLSAEEARAFVEAAKEQGAAGTLYIVLLASGMRPGEALGLRWEDFGGEALRIRRALVRARNARDWSLLEPKTPRSRRTIPLPDFAADALREHRRRQAAEQLRAGPEWKDHGLIFTDEMGEPLRWRTLARREFEWILFEADLPRIRPYDLRHTCASLLLAAGVNPKVVSERLGHATVALTLDTYSDVLPGLQEEATEKLEAVFGAQA